MLDHEKIIDLIGKPFRDGGRGPDAYDCIGLAREVFRRFGVEIKDYKISCHDASRIDAAAKSYGQIWTKLSRPEPLCMVTFRNNQTQLVDHVGVYLDEGVFIHVMEKMAVSLVRVNHHFWGPRIEGFYRHDR